MSVNDDGLYLYSASRISNIPYMPDPTPEIVDEPKDEDKETAYLALFGMRASQDITAEIVKSPTVNRMGGNSLLSLAGLLITLIL